jgi:hypothetical protein
MRTSLSGQAIGGNLHASHKTFVQRHIGLAERAMPMRLKFCRFWLA